MDKKNIFRMASLTMVCLGLQTTALQAAPPQIDLEDYPVIDCSLACVPLCEKLAMAVTGCSEIEAEETLDWFSNTNPSYIALAGGKRDLILSYEASAQTKEILEEMEDLQMELTPVGKDALVFLVNADNPVDELTTQQLRDIYAGKITNWKEVGGKDAPIVPFQRPENSGSQTLMRMLLMQDTEMMEPTINLIDGMEGLIRSVASFDSGADSIGFSVYYYTSEMEGNDQIKILRVDGVEPTNDTIREGSYSLVNAFYVGVTDQSAANALEIRDWLLTEEGQALVEECGYVPAQ